MEESKYIELGIAFISGILITFVGAYVSKRLQTKAENERIKKEAKFRVYMNLLNIHSMYFWFTTAETHNEEVPSEIKGNTRKITWQTADILRENDGIEFQEQILDVLFNEGFKSAAERSIKLEDITSKLGELVNLKDKKVISRIGENNPKHLFVQGMKNSNAPGSFR